MEESATPATPGRWSGQPGAMTETVAMDAVNATLWVNLEMAPTSSY
jgi:hypothetical protein